MKHSVNIIIFGLFLTLCYGTPTEPRSTPRFTLVEERSSNGSHAISVLFPDGHEDTLILDRHYFFEEDRIAQVEYCNYIGHLENDPEACVAMTGCIGSEDVEFTILSEHVTESPMLKWTKDGIVETIEHPYTHGFKNNRMSTNPNQTFEDDEVIDDEIEAAFFKAEEACSGGGCTLPKTMELQLRVAWDKRFRDKTGGTDSKAMTWMHAALVHVQAYYCHASLGSRIKVDWKYYWYYPDKSFLATSHTLNSLYSTTKSDLGSMDLVVYMGYDDGSKDSVGKKSNLGIANVGTVCTASKRKHSINMWNYHKSYAAQTIAHEMGHNLGMDHDFAKSHGGNGSPEQSESKYDCDGVGLMSYDPTPNKWSSCSKSDFQVQYKEVGAANWCMPELPEIEKICKGDRGCSKIGGTYSWKGDSYCDDKNNNEACDWDGGDCCGISWWNFWYRTTYCHFCQCLDPAKPFSHNSFG